MAVFTGLSEYFRGAGRFCGASKNVSKYFRALLNIFGALFNIYGEHFTFTGSVLYVIIIYGALLIIFGDIKFTLKLLRTILNFCGILPQTDRHTSHESATCRNGRTIKFINLLRHKSENEASKRQTKGSRRTRAGRKHAERDFKTMAYDKCTARVNPATMQVE